MKDDPIVTTPILQKFGTNMRQRRKFLGYTLQMLADMTRLDRTHLNLIELGQRNTTLQTASKIATALDISVKDLLS